MRVSPNLIIGALITATVLVAGYVGIQKFDKSLCSLEVIRRTPSPDGRLEAVLFQRNCGATTDFATNLSVVRTGRVISSLAGNLLIADSNHGRAPLDSGYVVHVSVEWIASDSLMVRYDARARLFKK